MSLAGDLTPAFLLKFGHAESQTNLKGFLSFLVGHMKQSKLTLVYEFWEIHPIFLQILPPVSVNQNA